MVFLSTVCGQSSSMTSEQITSCCLWLVILPPPQSSIPPSFYETNITVTASGECTISVHSITQKGHYWVLGVPSHLSPRKMRVILKNTPMQWLSSWGYLFKSGFTCARNTPYYSQTTHCWGGSSSWTSSHRKYWKEGVRDGSICVPHAIAKITQEDLLLKKGGREKSSQTLRARGNSKPQLSLIQVSPQWQTSHGAAWLWPNIFHCQWVSPGNFPPPVLRSPPRWLLGQV